MAFFKSIDGENEKRKRSSIQAGIANTAETDSRILMQRQEDLTNTQMTPLSVTDAPIVQKTRAAEDPYEPQQQQYIDRAVQAANSVSKDMDNAWTDSKNNTEKVKEHSGAIVERQGENANKETLALNVRPGKSGHSKPKTKGGEIEKKTDQVVGEFHTHPYSIKDIDRTTGSYNFDGTGMGPSGGDFVSLASIKKLSPGYFMVLESGNKRFIIVITDPENFKMLMSDLNVEQFIDDEAGKAILDPDNAERNSNAKTPKSHDLAHETGVINALRELQTDHNLGDPGFVLLKSIDQAKSKYEQIF